MERIEKEGIIKVVTVPNPNDIEISEDVSDTTGRQMQIWTIHANVEARPALERERSDAAESDIDQMTDSLV